MEMHFAPVMVISQAAWTGMQLKMTQSNYKDEIMVSV
jgi:hypothetical protein